MRSLLRKIALSCLLATGLLFAPKASAQTATLSGTVTGTVNGVANTALDNGTVTFNLANCGGTPTAGSASYSIGLNSSGVLSGSVEENSTNGCAGTSYYIVSAYDSTGALNWRQKYEITTGSFDVATASPLTAIPVPGPYGGSSTASNSVQYPTSGSVAYFFGDSRLVVASPATTTASAVSCNGTTCTITDTQTYAAGQQIQFQANSGWSPTCLNWGMATILSSGLSGSQFEVSETALGINATCSGAVTGTGGVVQDATYFLPEQVAQQPYFNGHVSVHNMGIPGNTLAEMVTNYTTEIHPFTPAVTGVHPTYIFLEAGLNDAQTCQSAAVMETDFQELMQDLHTDGAIVVAMTSPATVNMWESLCATQAVIPILQGFNNWLDGQGTGASVGNGTYPLAYWDHSVDLATFLGNSYSTSLYNADQTHLDNAGASLAASWVNAAMSVQGSMNTGGIASQGPNHFVGPQTVQVPQTGAGNYPMGYSLGVFGQTESDWSLNDYYFGGLQPGVPYVEANGIIMDSWIESSPTDFAHQLPPWGVFGFNANTVGSGVWGYPPSAGISYDGSVGGIDVGNGHAQDATGYLKMLNLYVSSLVSGNCVQAAANGKLTTTTNPCGTSGGSSYNGTVTYTTSTTASSADNLAHVLMNCSSSPCIYTLPASQPSTKWQTQVKSIGSVLATIAVASPDTYNLGTAVPTLIPFQPIDIDANTQTSTDYEGPLPLAPGTNTTVSSTSHSQSVNSTGGGGGGFGAPVTLTPSSPNGGTSYTLSITPTTPAASMFFVNGVKMVYGSFYTISGNTLTISGTPLPNSASGDVQELYAY